MNTYFKWFASHGIHALVDGQFGSTGKGLFASWLAREAVESKTEFRGVISNAGPNSGHTFYHGGVKHVLKQLPTFAVKSALMGEPIPAFLSAGAVIDPDILYTEALKYPMVPIYVHHNAGILLPSDKAAEKEGSIAAVAGTRSGTGNVLVRKILRDPAAIWGAWVNDGEAPPNIYMYDDSQRFETTRRRYFMEVSQGFSLGLNSSFYPKVTSRECTVMQGISDARVPPRDVLRTFMVARTFPIRVGNVDGHSSGDWYNDQRETSWDELGVEPELTTVTQRIRRVATFSENQMIASISANAPDVVLWNFMNYLTDHDARLAFWEATQRVRAKVAYNFVSMYADGPHDDNVKDHYAK